MCAYFCPFCIALGLSDAIVGFYPAFHVNMLYPTVPFTQEVVGFISDSDSVVTSTKKKKIILY